MGAVKTRGYAAARTIAMTARTAPATTSLAQIRSAAMNIVPGGSSGGTYSGATRWSIAPPRRRPTTRFFLHLATPSAVGVSVHGQPLAEPSLALLWTSEGNQPWSSWKLCTADCKGLATAALAALTLNI